MNLNHQKYIQWAGWLSVAVNTLLFILKYWAGVVSGSIALKADAWDTLTDCFSSFIVIVGGKLAGKPADKEHPFGHGRVEHIAAMVIGILLAILSFNFIISAYEKFISRGSGNFGPLAVAVTLVSVLTKEALARYGFWASRKTGSAMLKANAWNHRSDAFSSLMILVGIFLGMYFWWIDSVLALIVALMIARASYEILSREIRSLLGEEVDPQLVRSISREVTSLLDREVYIHHLHLHKYGNHQELSCHIKLPPQMTIEEAHAICTRIEDMLLVRFNLIATIHPEPLKNKRI
ncbi:MAG: cation diffusion facilitator family transporter [Mangrovibacterium sp.]